MLASHCRVVVTWGGNPRRFRLLQHHEMDWFDSALEQWVKEVADRVVLWDSHGQPVPYPFGNLPPFHVHFPDAGPPPTRATFCDALERVLLFCTLPYREYRDTLQATFSREAGRLNAASVASEKALNETLHVKKWTDVQMHSAVMKAQKTSGMFLPNSMFNNLVAVTSLFEGLNQSRPRISVEHLGKKTVGGCQTLVLWVYAERDVY